MLFKNNMVGSVSGDKGSNSAELFYSQESVRFSCGATAGTIRLDMRCNILFDSYPVAMKVFLGTILFLKVILMLIK